MNDTDKGRRMLTEAGHAQMGDLAQRWSDAVDADSAAVEIPADVKDNSRDVLRIQWRNTRRISAWMLDTTIRDACEWLSYPVYVWEDTDRDGNRVTLTRIVSLGGYTVDLFATYYYTRVACVHDCSGYAQRYVITVGADGVTRSEPTPLCGWHLDSIRRSARRMGGIVLESEPLVIGQH